MEKEVYGKMKPSSKSTMKKRILSILLSACLVASAVPVSAMTYAETPSPAVAADCYYEYPFQDPTLTVDERVNDLISRLTLDEKIGLMHQFSAAIQRFGIPQFRTGTETLHGVSWLGYATVFPQNIGLSQTWNSDLLQEVGNVLGNEVRAYNSVDNRFMGIDCWSPVVDLNRDPRSGRASEGMGEDAYLAGVLSTVIGAGMQGDEDDFYLKVIPTLKHFAAYGQEAQRSSYSANLGERNLYEYYLKVFEAAVSAGTVNSMMNGYNLVNGKPTMTMPELMDDVYGEWVEGGYEKGQFFMVTDASNTSNLYGSNAYYPNNYIGKAASIADSAQNGVAVYTPSDTNTPETRRNLYEAVARGMLTEAEIDDVIYGVLSVRCRAGDLDADPLNPYEALNKQNALVTDEHAAVAAQAAREQIVLLKNEGDILPLTANSDKVAVIGPQIDQNSTDFYAGTYPYTTFIGEEVVKKAGEGKAETARGIKLVQFKIAAGSQAGKYLCANDSKLVLTDDADDIGTQFYIYDYGYNNNLLRSVKTNKYIAMSNAYWNGGDVITTANEPGYQTPNRASQEWATAQNLGIVDGSKYGENIVGLAFAGGTDLPGTRNMIMANANGSVNASGNNFNNDGCKLEMITIDNGVDSASELAANSDVAIVCVGDQPHLTARETTDRLDTMDNIKLAASQEELVEKVAEANENTIVVIVGSYAFDINDIKNNPNVKGIVYTSHAGQELGSAVADVLFGDYAPAGRLTQTWYNGLSDLPPIDNYDIIEGERTYQYYNGTPLYEFGYGLTYTTFEYSNISVPGGGSYLPNDLSGYVDVSVDVKNSGDTASDEVVQLYAAFNGDSEIKHANKSLVGFQRIHLAPGESQTVKFTVPMTSLAIWDVSNQCFYVEPGAYQFTAAPSSSGIGGVSSGINVSGDKIAPRDLTKQTNAMSYDTYSSSEEKEAEIIPISVMEDDDYGIKSAAAGATVTYKNVNLNNAQGITLRASNPNAESAMVTVYAGDTEVGTIEIPSTGHQQTFINVGKELSFPSGAADLTLQFDKSEVGVKWLQLGEVTQASAEDFQLNTFTWNSNNNTTLSRLHVAVPAEITQAYSSATTNNYSKIALEAYTTSSGTVTAAPVWSVSKADGSPIDTVSIDANGVLSVLEGAENGEILVTATMGDLAVTRTITLKNQDVPTNTNADAIVIRSGWDSRPADISHGENQFSFFGNIYQEQGKLMLSAITYPVVDPGRMCTFEIFGDEECTTPTDLAVLSGEATIGYIEGQSRGADYASCNQWIQATGKGNGNVYVKATCGEVSYVSRIAIQGQGSESAYEKRLQAELYDETGNLEGSECNLRFDNVHGDEVGLQLNRIRNQDYAKYSKVDFGTVSEPLTMTMNYLKVSSEPATITFMLDDPVDGTKAAEITLTGDYDITNPNGEYANVVYHWEETTIDFNAVSGVHDLYLVFDISDKVPNTDISSTYNQVAGWLDLGINWLTFEGGSEEQPPVVDDGLDRTLLKDSIDAANIAKKNYPENLIEAVRVKFEAALEHALEVYQDQSGKYTQADIDQADDELVRMMQYLCFTADMEGLQNAIDHAREVIDSGLFENDEMMQAYQDALAAAEALLAEELITDTEITPAIKALEEAEAKLNLATVKLDLSRLQREIGLSDSTKLMLHLYIAGAETEAFTAELENAKALLAKAQETPEQVTQEEIDKQVQALHAARLALRLIPNKDALKSLIDTANAIDQTAYTLASVEVLKSALYMANVVYEDEQADEEDVKEAETELKAAIEGLVLSEEDNTDTSDTGDTTQSGSNSQSGNDSQSGNHNQSSNDNQTGSDSHNNNSNGNFQTGDYSYVVVWSLLLLAAFGAAALSVWYRKRRID